VIAADLGGPAETVEHGVTGWRVPAGDSTILAEAIEAVLALPGAVLERVGTQARAAVVEGYTVAAMQAATLAVYREVVDRRPWGSSGLGTVGLPDRHPRAWREDPRLSRRQLLFPRLCSTAFTAFQSGFATRAAWRVVGSTS
jgi:hypothetical protein